jgi:hypothetical protein
MYHAGGGGSIWGRFLLGEGWLPHESQIYLSFILLRKHADMSTCMPDYANMIPCEHASIFTYIMSMNATMHECLSMYMTGGGGGRAAPPGAGPPHKRKLNAVFCQH